MAALLLGAVLTGCGPGVAYKVAQPASLNGGTSESVQIYANGDWRDTGLDLVKGESYRITAEGRWSNGLACGFTDASGAGTTPLCSGDPLHLGVNASSLIGRIGRNGHPFGVGTALTMTAPVSGRLYLRDYDPIPYDNTGFQNVTVVRSAATAPLAAAGGGPEARTVDEGATAAPAPPAPQALVPTGKRVALVVGEGAYRYVPQLANPPNDARLIARALQNSGFELIGGGAQINLDKDGFVHAIQTFGRRIAGANVALFYYAGHGLQVHGTNWLVPVSANPTREADLDFQMVDAELVLKQMQDAGTRLNIMVLDACRNNPFGGRGMRSATGGLAQMQAPEGTLISYATQPGSVAQDGAGADSPYSAALAQAINTPGLDLFRLFNQVGLEVKRETGDSQLPWVSNSPISGDFYFSPDKSS